MNRRVKSFFKTNIISSSTRQHNPRHTTASADGCGRHLPLAARGCAGGSGRRIMMMALMVIATAAGSAVFLASMYLREAKQINFEGGKDRRRIDDDLRPTRSRTINGTSGEVPRVGRGKRNAEAEFPAPPALFFKISMPPFFSPHISTDRLPSVSSFF